MTPKRIASFAILLCQASAAMAQLEDRPRPALPGGQYYLHCQGMQDLSHSTTRLHENLNTKPIEVYTSFSNHTPVKLLPGSFRIVSTQIVGDKGGYTFCATLETK